MAADAVIIGAEADMVDAGDVANMLDMIGDLGDRRLRNRMGRVPGVDPSFAFLGLASEERGETSFLGRALAGTGAPATDGQLQFYCGLNL